jgi:hypothetical protein
MLLEREREETDSLDSSKKSKSGEEMATKMVPNGRSADMKSVTIPSDRLTGNNVRDKCLEMTLSALAVDLSIGIDV